MLSSFEVAFDRIRALLSCVDAVAAIAEYVQWLGNFGTILGLTGGDVRGGWRSETQATRG